MEKSTKNQKFIQEKSQKENQEEKNINIETNIERKSREEYLNIQEKNIIKSKEIFLKEKENMSIYSGLISLDFQPNGKMIDKDFKEVVIKELKIGKNKLNYIALKIISKIAISNFFSEVIFIGEDNNKDVINIFIIGYNDYYEINDWDELEQKIYSEGKYIVIIEPNYIMGSSGNDAIKVDYPNETIIFESQKELEFYLEKNQLKDTNNYKELGILMLKLLSYENAIFFFKEAINISLNSKNISEKIGNSNGNNQELINLYLNLSKAYFQYGYKTKVIENADKIINMTYEYLSKNETNNKEIKEKYLDFFTQGLSYKIKSLVGLRKYKEAYKLISNEEPIYKNEVTKLLQTEEISPLIAKIKEYLENEDGKYDFISMVKQEEKNFNLENADYISEKIKVQKDEVKGIKIVAKEKIKKGELIIAEKAIGAFDLFHNASIRTEEDLYKYANIFNCVYRKVVKYPLDYKGYFILYDGNNLNSTIEKRQKLLTNILAGNEKITKEQVNGVLSKNTYKTNRPTGFFLSVAKGLWTNSSFMNHSCCPNIHYFGIGDFHFTHACQDIEKGSEINTHYIANFNQTYEARHDKLQKTWGFLCQCELCIFENKKLNSPDEKISSIKRQYESYIAEFISFFDEVLLTNNKTNDFVQKETEFKILIENFNTFVETNKKSLSSYELKKGYLLLEKSFLYFYDLDSASESFDKVIEYDNGKSFTDIALNYQEFIKTLSDLIFNGNIDRNTKDVCIKIKDYYEPQFIQFLCLNTILSEQEAKYLYENDFYTARKNYKM